MKKILIVLMATLAAIAVLIASAGGWFYWRYLTASRDSLIEKSITLSPNETYRLTLDPKRRLKRAKILVEFRLKDKCASVNLSDKSTNEVDYPDGKTIVLEAFCVDNDGIEHPLYIESYAPTRLFWVFAEDLPKKTKFRSLEIASSGEQELADIAWIDCQPM